MKGRELALVLRRLPAGLLAGACIAAPAQAGWVAQNSGTIHDLHSVNFDHSTDLRAWACGDSGTVVYTSNGGATWTLQDTGTTAHLYGIVFHEDGGSVIAVGEHGTILRTIDRGTTWTLIPSPTEETLRDASDFRYYAVGDNGTILKSYDLGLTWSIVDSGSQADLRSVIGFEPFPTAVGEGGTILRGDPQGTVWQLIPSGTTETLNGVPLFPTRILVGDEGTILRSTSFGGPWSTIPILHSAALRSVGDANGAVYVVGSGGTILKTTDNGLTWGAQPAPTSKDLNGTFFYLFAHVGYAVGNAGTILKTTDGGGPSQPVDVESEGELDVPHWVTCAPNPFRGSARLTYALPREAEVSVTVYDVGGRAVQQLYAGRQPRGVYSVMLGADRLGAGVYLCRLAAGARLTTLRTTLLR